MARSQAEALKARLLYQDVCLAAQRLDLLRKGSAHKEVFKPHVLALRDVVQQVCLKLMFLHPLDYGRKAEELLWRKMYSDVAMLLLRTKRKHVDTFKQWEGALRAHLKGGLRFYDHVFLFLQEHCDLRLLSYTDGPHSAIHLIGCKKAGPASEEEVAWVQMACHRCRLYLGDLFRFQNEFPALATKDLAERCYTEPCQWPCTWACPSTSWGLSQEVSTMTLKPRTSTSTASAPKCLFKGHLGTSKDSMIMREKGTAS